MTKIKTLLAAAAAVSLFIPVTASAQIEKMRAGGVSIATVPGYNPSAVQTVTRDYSSHANGRLWVQRGHLSGENTRPSLGWPEPGPGAYGAHEDDFHARVFARVGGVLVEFSPWVRQTRMNSAGVQDRLELVRQEWLSRNGYTGGVRTVLNPVATHVAPAEEAWSEYEVSIGLSENEEAKPASGELQPRATIRVPATRTKIKAKMMVDSRTIWSLPPTASPELLAAVRPAVVVSAN